MFNARSNDPILRATMRQRFLLFLYAFCRCSLFFSHYLRALAVNVQTTAARPNQGNDAFNEVRVFYSMVKEVKRGSSLWLTTKGPHLQDFAWQNGYGILRDFLDWLFVNSIGARLH